MPDSSKIALRLRLEDAVALAFFLVSLGMRIIFSELESHNYSPAGVLVIIPAVFLLLLKELVHYFVTGRENGPGLEGSLRSFVRPYWEIVRDWFPFLIILMMYYSLWGDATHLLVPVDRDKLLMAWDQKLFGFQASVALQGFVSPSLTAWMSFAYFFHLMNIPIVACFIYTRRPHGNFREMMCGVLVICFFGILGYLLVPAVGPVYTLRDQFTVPLSQPLAVFNREVEFMDFARIHYLVDIVAGLILAPVCFWLSNRLFRGYQEIRVPLPVPDAWARRLAKGGITRPLPKAASKVEERS